MLGPLGPLRTTVLMQHAFESCVPFFFAHWSANPECAIVSGIFGEWHIVRNDFDNPGFRDTVVKFLAEGEVLLGCMVGVVKDDERWRLADDECRFQKALGAFDGIASIEGGILCHVAML